MTVRFESEAMEEYRAAALYSRRRFGLGREFVAAVESALEDIASDPLRCRDVGDDVRLFHLRRFPYCIFFHHLSGTDVISIYAVAHHSREPGYWRGRGR